MTQNPANSVNPASASGTRPGHGTELGKDEQNRLILAIESAMEVRRQDQFDAWLSGPFRDLLPHEVLFGVEWSQGQMVRPLTCLYHGLLDTRSAAVLCDPRKGLVARLIQAPAVADCESCVVDARRIYEILGTDVHADGGVLLHNAVIEHVILLSGDAYAFVLGNVPADELTRSRAMFRLVASHLKMALARTLTKRGAGVKPALTPRELEVLRWISMGKSNREISGMLGISAITLKSHISKLYRKLNVQSRAEAVARGRAQTQSQTEPH